MKRIPALIVALALFALAELAAARENAGPKAEWFESHGGSGEESHGHFLIACDDGGFLQVGETGFVPDSARILVVKVDSKGKLEWKKEFGKPGHNLGNSALEVDDGYLVCGALNHDSVLIKLDKKSGAVLFQEMQDTPQSDAFEHIAPTKNGFLAVGYDGAEDEETTFFAEGRGTLDFLDADGNQTGTQSLNHILSQAYRIRPSGEHFIVAGLTEDARDFGAMKIKQSGVILWKRKVGGEKDDHCFGMDVGPDGSVFLTGHTRSNTRNWDTFTVKLDPGGVPLWQVARGQPRGFDERYIHDEAWGVAATPDGGCIVAAGTGDESRAYSNEKNGRSSDRWEAYLIKFDTDGKVEWEETFADPGRGDWAAEDIVLTSDGGAMVAIDNGQFGFLKIAPFLGSD